MMLSGLLFAGWVFLLPPLEPDTQGIPQPRPRRAWKDWSQEGAFDHAQECDAARQRAIRESQEATKIAGYDSLDIEHKARKRLQAVEEAYANSRCIPAEQLYPPASANPK